MASSQNSQASTANSGTVAVQSGDVNTGNSGDLFMKTGTSSTSSSLSVSAGNGEIGGDVRVLGGKSLSTTSSSDEYTAEDVLVYGGHGS